MSKAVRADRAIHLFDSLPHIEPAAAPVFHPAMPLRARPLVGLIRNPRSHRNGGASGQVEPRSPGATIISHAPERRGELVAILAEFAAARIDLLAIDGGDGTVRDVLTCGAGAFGENWPPLIVLPHGKTNALAHDLGIGRNWTLEDALVAAKRGSLVRRRPLVVAHADQPQARISGFVLGGGVFAKTIELGQRAHGAGAFNSAVVGVTALWSLARMLLGGAGDRWRRTTPMRIADVGGSELAHRGGGPADERFMLIASTLKTLPVNLRPFGPAQGNLRMMVLDNSRRALLACLPLIAAGRAGRTARRLGYHGLGGEAFELNLGERFILDGEAFPAGRYHLSAGQPLRFVAP